MLQNTPDEAPALEVASRGATGKKLRIDDREARGIRGTVGETVGCDDTAGEGTRRKGGAGGGGGFVCAESAAGAPVAEELEVGLTRFDVGGLSAERMM